MTDTNAFLVKPKIGFWNKVRAHLAYDYDTFDPDHQLYAPERFVLGHFKAREEGFKLSQGGIFYRDSQEALRQYKKSLDDGKLEVVKSLLLPETVLETIARQWKVYVNAKEQISEFVQSIQSINQYSV